MKKMAIAVFMVVTLFSVSSWAYQITIYQNAYSSGIGGEFGILPSADLAWVLNNYSGTTKNVSQINGGPTSGTFESFCLEYGEHFTPSVSYQASISDGAKGGGVGAVNGTDKISVGTAWLYAQFTDGTLAGYFSGNRNTNAGFLQATIWGLEEERAIDTNNPFTALVISHFVTLDAAQVDNNGFYSVKVLNVGNGNQDQLVRVPEPASLLFLGAGLLGLGFAIRRRKS